MAGGAFWNKPKQILHPECHRTEVIFVPRHLEGARRPVICNLQLSLVIVLESKHGEMDHTAAVVSQSLSLHSLPCHALDEAELA